MGNAIQTEITQELESSYIGYAVATLTDRAIPDIRDGLKPSQRRILLSLRDLGIGARAQHRKCAMIAGHTSGNYHPHGEAVVYPTLVRMVQPFSLRYPLLDGQGNFGNVGGSPPAAMRYTEARMAVASEDMLDELEVDGQWTVPTVRNYDETKDEPTVLPSRFPNLLCNGASGIAVGWATEIPPHNVRDIVAGLVALIENDKISDADLFKLVKGPDFPTGGIIHGTKGIHDLYKNGMGHLVVTGRVKIDTKKTPNSITVYELPYGVTTQVFKEKADEAFKAGKLTGVSKMLDASSKRMDNPIQVIFYLKKGEEPQVVLNQLYEHTPLQETYAGNMIALVEGKDHDRIPAKVALGLRPMMQSWINFREDVVVKRTGIKLQSTKVRISQLEGYVIATDPKNLDRVITIIKEGNNAEQVTKTLTDEFNLTEFQVKHILALTLSKLMKLEREELTKELAAKAKQAKDYEALLADRKLVLKTIIQELREIEKAYGDDRRTSIEGEMKEFNPEDLIPEEQVIVTMTHSGYIKRTPLEAYRKTARGAKGVIGAGADDDDFVTKVYPASTHDCLLAFTNRGTVHWIKVYDIPDAVRAGKGRALVNLINLKEDEKVSSIIPITGKFDEQREIVLATAQGLVKKSKLSEFSHPRSGGIIAIKLKPDDMLVGAALTEGKSHLLLATKAGYVLRFDESEIGSQGRDTSGRRGIGFKIPKDKVCALIRLSADDKRNILTFTRGGIGKRTGAPDYPIRHCGGYGVLTSQVTTDPGSLISTLAVVDDNDEAIIVTNHGKAVRIAAKDIRVSDRKTKGVRLITLEEGQKVVDAAVIASENL